MVHFYFIYLKEILTTNYCKPFNIYAMWLTRAVTLPLLFCELSANAVLFLTLGDMQFYKWR